MSRSYRKHKIMGNTCARSEKKDKRFHNRRMRRKVHDQIGRGEFERPFPVDNEVTDPWTMDKDGKQYFADATKKDMSK